MPLGVVTALLGLVAVFVATLPLGTLLLRTLERLTHTTVSLTVTERLLLCPYIVGGLFFVLASLSLPFLTGAVVVGCLIAGAIGFVAFTLATGEWRLLTRAPAPFRLIVPMVVFAATAILLVVEVTSIGTKAYPNAYDGSVQSLYVHLISTQHSIPWTLQPFGEIGITYPQGAAVWMSLPVFLLGWPVQSSIVALPLLFLVLGVPASYCLGIRWSGGPGRNAELSGAVFALGVAFLLSWPRLFVGGSFDFAIGLPLFFLAVGWLEPFIRVSQRKWGDVLLFAGLQGILTGLSVALGEALFLLLVIYLATFRAGGIRRTLRQWSSRLSAILAAGLLFVSRSIAGFVMWFDSPLHVLNALGQPPYATQPVAPFPPLNSLVEYLDPFVPFKGMLSPLPVLSVEIAVLLAAGLVLGVLTCTELGKRLRPFLPRNQAAMALVTMFTMFGWTAFLMVISGTILGTSFFNITASVYESSFLLFIFLGFVALFPILAAVHYFRIVSARPDGGGLRGSDSSRYRNAVLSRSRLEERSNWKQVGAVALIVIPLASGAVLTGAQVPSYLSDHVAMFSNVTNSDVEALQWVGTHLPSCSRVLVAQGSAGEFLPLYAQVQLLFPMVPYPLNLSYNIALNNLIQGSYTNATQRALTSLTVTDVFATGQTSISYRPFNVTEMELSPQFILLFSSGDAKIFEYLPGDSLDHCPH